LAWTVTAITEAPLSTAAVLAAGRIERAFELYGVNPGSLQVQFYPVCHCDRRHRVGQSIFLLDIGKEQCVIFCHV
jgi:hypothetical protein